MKLENNLALNPGKTFVLSKTTKRMMTSITDKERRLEFKRAMIQAQLASEIKVSSKEHKEKD